MKVIVKESLQISRNAAPVPSAKWNPEMKSRNEVGKTGGSGGPFWRYVILHNYLISGIVIRLISLLQITHMEFARSPLRQFSHVEIESVKEVKEVKAGSKPRFESISLLEETYGLF